MFNLNGIKHVEKFLSEKKIIGINQEINEISKSQLLNGKLKSPIWINKNLYEIPNPIININTTNLLDIAIDIQKEIQETTNKKYFLTSLRVTVEKQNSFPLDWHTDHSPNILRAIVYLMGGENNNGNLSYINKSHKKIHDKKIHKIDPYENKLHNDIFEIDSKVGDLVYFDINGFHKKNSVKYERRIIIFEFQEKNSTKKKSKINFDNTKINENILKNLDKLLFLDKNLIEFEDPLFTNETPEETPPKIVYELLKNFIITKIKKIKKKILRF